MRVRCHAQGKFYTIQCPVGTRVVHRSDQPDGEQPQHDHIVVPLNGKEIRIPSDPPELLPLLAESGNFGVFLVGEPEPDLRLEGVSCPSCGEEDVTWLQLDDGSESAHCDRCGADFALSNRQVMPIPASDSTDG
jgi:ribosomal protein S27E